MDTKITKVSLDFLLTKVCDMISYSLILITQFVRLRYVIYDSKKITSEINNLLHNIYQIPFEIGCQSIRNSSSHNFIKTIDGSFSLILWQRQWLPQLWTKARRRNLYYFFYEDIKLNLPNNSTWKHFQSTPLNGHWLAMKT